MRGEFVGTRRAVSEACQARTGCTRDRALFPNRVGTFHPEKASKMSGTRFTAKRCLEDTNAKAAKTTFAMCATSGWDRPWTNVGRGR